MKNKWKKYQLGECLDKVLGGGTPSKKKADFWGGDIHWATVKDMKDGVYKLKTTVDKITKEGLSKSSSKLIPRDTVVISTRMGLGRCFIADIDTAINQDLKALFPKKEKLETRYLLWLMASLAEKIQLLGTGTTVKGITVETLKTIEVLLPPLPTQRKIAGILSAYDDLIENNTRRIEILEEMARMLYQEWFVKFRFPGHQDVLFVESELGLIPEGWEVKKLGDVVLEIIDYRGKTPKKLGGDWSESGIIAISAKNIKQGKLINLDQSKYVDEYLYKKWMKSELLKGDILMTSEAPLGELYYLVEHQRFCLSQRVYSIRSNPDIIYPSILYTNLSSPRTQDEIRARQSGTTVLGIRQTELRKVPLIVPSQEIQNKALPILENLFKRIDNLDKKNINLRKTRDLLLPRLISSEIDVEDLDIKVGEISN